jgi:hypothetical protein
MLDEAGFTPGIEELDAYSFITTYPQNILPQLITFPYNADLKQMKMDVLGMTSAEYSAVVSPATAIDYDCSFLPTSPQADFMAQEIGNGTTTQGTDEILLSKAIGFSYGWRFIDTSGKIQPDSSYRVDVTFDASAAIKIDPAPDADPVILILISDGAVQVELSFVRLAGVDTLEIESGAFMASSSIDWSSQQTVVSLVRNQKADTYTVVVNGEPIVAGPTASFTAAPGIPPGLQFHLDPGGLYDIVDFPLQDILFTSTQTVFSAAWNFLHDQQAPFIGDPANSKDFLLTKKGPLVKGWGDATPATQQDVVVYVNGSPVEVLLVNPYYGKIFLVIPIPLMPPGVMDVAVDYIWFPSPIMAMAGLNTLGVVLNKYDCKPLCPTGGNSEGVGLPGGGTNGVEFSRFPMGLVLGPAGPDIRKPLLRSPRFIAFQKPYTASLNSPTTMLLNRNPHQVALSDQERDVEGEVVFFEGVRPPNSPFEEDPWTLVGEIETLDPDNIPAGIVINSEVTAGYIQVYKVTSGPYGTGNVVFYEREIDVSFDQSIIIVTRFQIQDEHIEFDGVFSGVGFGCHTDNHLYLVGALQINDVQHIGMLVDPAFPELAESWQLAYQTPIEILDATTFSAQSDELPLLIRERLISDDLVRFQIVEGSQAGVYEVIEIVDQSDGTSTVSIDPSSVFPADPSLFGNRDFTAVFESRWDGDGIDNRPNTYRLVVKHDIKFVPEGYAELFVGGSFAGKALELNGAPAFAIPPDSVLLLPTGNEGEVFFGSLDRRASNLSDWYFVRYGTEPGATTLNFRQIVVAAEMNALPEDDPNNIWFLTQEFGSRIIDVTGDQVLLKATSSNEELGVEDQDLSIGYARLEGFLTRRMAIDVDTTFQIDSGILGAGDIQYIVRDGLREVLLANVLYETTATENQLLFMESVSLSGLLLPDQEGWLKTGSLTTERVQGHRLQFEQVTGETLIYALNLLQGVAVTLAGDGRIFESRIQIFTVGATDPDGDTGIFFGTDVGPIGSARGVGLQLRVAAAGDPDQVFLFSLETGIEVASFDVSWNNGEIHTYRVIADTDVDTVTVIVDDVVLGTADLNLFGFSSTDTQATLGFASATTSATLEVEDYSAIVLPPSTAKRTLGVWLGGDVNDIDEWKLPRTDALDVPNSSLDAVIEEMDWRQRIRARIHRDPGWGVTILRPDLPPPPYFTGNFATQFTEPSAGWINVEYRDLPRVSSTDTLGYVAFGALDPRSITQMRIDEVRYRIYQYASENIIMPPHMVLNQYNVITSGEFQEDITVEVITVLSENATQVSLNDANITGARVFNLQYEDEDGNQVLLTPESFTFDEPTQIVTLNDPLEFRNTDPVPDPAADRGSGGNDLTPFPDPNLIHIPVIVRFAPGRPLTKTYLCSQPLLDGSTLLNEGTPAFETAQVMKDDGFLAWGSRINDPNDLLNTDPDFILNDPFRFIDFSSDKKTQYEDIDFCEVSEGEECRLSPFCDDSLPGASEAGDSGTEAGDIGNGLIDIGMEGLAFTETEPIKFQDGPTNGFGQLPSSVFLKASGGNSPPGGNLNDAILFTPLGPETPPYQTADGSVGWSVFGQLYDTVTNTVTNIFFGTESLGP